MRRTDEPAPAVLLAAHDPRRADIAVRKGARLRDILGPVAIAIEHIGSTAISGIVAKSVIDLPGIVGSIDALDGRQAAMVEAGYDWRGEYCIAGRRYRTLSDPLTGRRMFQLHCFARGAAAAARHIAFRDYLRADPARSAEYERVKQVCAARHFMDGAAYTGCKAGWIAATLKEVTAGRG